MHRTAERLSARARLGRLVVAAHERVSDGLELFGAGLITAGVGMIYVPAGLIAGGVLAIGLGFLIGQQK